MRYQYSKYLNRKHEYYSIFSGFHTKYFNEENNKNSWNAYQHKTKTKELMRYDISDFYNNDKMNQIDREFRF